jgi:hypothetical protein
MVATAERKKQIVIQMLALFLCDQVLSMVLYSQIEISANTTQSKIHLIDEIIAFDL